jgi:phosphoribosyl-AMP cyclohydrolase
VVDAEFVARWAERLGTSVADAVAVVLKGSHARGDAGPYSDVDFDVLTVGGPRFEYPLHFAEIDGRTVHVSVAVRDVHGWLADDEPERWALLLPAYEPTKLVWAVNDKWRGQIEGYTPLHRPGDPELEELIGTLGTVRNAQAAGDELALRYAAQQLAELCPSVLRPLNPSVRVGSRIGALRVALDFPVAPIGYQEDMLTCLGLRGEAVSGEDVHDAAYRLVTGVVALLQENVDLITPLVPPDLPESLRSGMLDRYLRN